MKKLLSYLFRVKLHARQTDYNGTLDITLLNGKKLLDTAISNYSYGSLQRILHKALQKLPFDDTIQAILVLGMGAGSIIQTIRKDFGSDAEITLVEIDAVVIEIAEKEFGLSKFTGINVVHADAVAFMKKGMATFDLVIVDLFIIDTIPDDVTGADFIYTLSQKLRPGARLVFNTIRDTMSRPVFTGLLNELNKEGIETRVLKKLEGSNDVILGVKNTGTAIGDLKMNE